MRLNQRRMLFGHSEDDIRKRGLASRETVGCQSYSSRESKRAAYYLSGNARSWGLDFPASNFDLRSEWQMFSFGGPSFFGGSGI